MSAKRFHMDIGGYEMKCRNCGNEIQNGKKFCGKCGTPVINQCPQCGKELSDGVKFCPGCGYNLVRNKPDESLENRSSASSQGTKKSKKSGTFPVIIIIIAALLALLTGAVIFGFYHFASPMKKQAVESEQTSDRNSEGNDSKDKRKQEEEKETEEETTKKSGSAETEDSMETETTAAPSFIWGGGRVDETTAPWSSEEETTEVWGGLTDTEETGYVLPDSNLRFLQESDLDGMTLDQLRVARNEIYARHGRMFDSEDLQDYFNRQPWYIGSVAPKDFDEDVLNSYEKANLEVIKAVEAKLK